MNEMYAIIEIGSNNTKTHENKYGRWIKNANNLLGKKY